MSELTTCAADNKRHRVWGESLTRTHITWDLDSLHWGSVHGLSEAMVCDGVTVGVEAG